MSGGRWVRQDNGDYQHFSDEEYAEGQRRGLVWGYFSMVVIGAVFGYVALTDDEFVFGNFHNFEFILFCVCAFLFTIGVIALKIYASIGEVLLYTVVFLVICGILFYIFNGKTNETSEAQEKSKKETVSCPKCGSSVSMTFETTFSGVSTEKCPACGTFVSCPYDVNDDGSIRIRGISCF